MEVGKNVVKEFDSTTIVNAALRDRFATQHRQSLPVHRNKTRIRVLTQGASHFLIRTFKAAGANCGVGQAKTVKHVLASRSAIKSAKATSLP
ncbi:hypothetical protein [Noviherbaspirillum humi]|uniref:hypothetical protein n=1 Tax=Noviherbaspirillum humi TaxID=1688639 RepID=UPI0011609B39|nr:hypothetical protein [Noviherbaspirillum humi]